ncbi:MAG: hypothetical protein AAGG09_17655, partial [Pseudomonadota bacterium]
LTVCVLCTPALGWEARSSDICDIVHSGPEGDVRVTFDPAASLYEITVTRPAPWPGAPVFAIQFGNTGLTISTNRHRLSAGNTALSVSDTGFGNVLLGLESAGTATALSGDASAMFDLTGAPEAVAAFRACTTAPSV